MILQAPDIQRVEEDHVPIGASPLAATEIEVEGNFPLPPSKAGDQIDSLVHHLEFDGLAVLACGIENKLLLGELLGQGFEKKRLAERASDLQVG